MGSLQRAAIAVLVAGAGALALAPLASGHLERPSYWPDPAPDATVSPPAGGKVPEARPLASAVTEPAPATCWSSARGTVARARSAISVSL